MDITRQRNRVMEKEKDGCRHSFDWDYSYFREEAIKWADISLRTYDGELLNKAMWDIKGTV